LRIDWHTRFEVDDSYLEGPSVRSENRVYYYRARYYDSATGRFINEDQLGFDGDSANFFAYALSSPTNYTDPEGLKTEVCCRPLRNFVGKATGKNHCYIRITPKSGPPKTLGLHREFSDDVPIPGGARPLVNDWTDQGGTCADVKDASECKEKQLIQNALSDLSCPSCRSGYSAFTTNSNFWVSNVLRKSQMTPPDFPGARNSPGYFHQPGQ
jgi:RHS repeat-associated protein